MSEIVILDTISTIAETLAEIEIHGMTLHSHYRDFTKAELINMMKSLVDEYNERAGVM